MNRSHLEYTSKFEKLAFVCLSFKFCSTVKQRMCFNSSISQMSVNQSLSLPTIILIESDEIMYRKINEESYDNPVCTSTDHSDSNTYLPCLLYLFIILFLLSMFFPGHLFPLIAYFSGLLFNFAKTFSHCLISLSNKLDQTLWPWLLIKFLYISFNYLHILLATYFEEEFITHLRFYKINACAKTTLYTSHTSEMCFNKRYNFSVCKNIDKTIPKCLVCCFKFIFIERNCKQFLQELCATVSRRILPGKLISDIPKETQPSKCTDNITSCSDQFSQCSTRLEANFQPMYNSESTHTCNDDAKAIKFETDKLPDAIQPLNYQYSDFNDENFDPIEEINTDITPGEATKHLSKYASYQSLHNMTNFVIPSCGHSCIEKQKNYYLPLTHSAKNKLKAESASNYHQW